MIHFARSFREPVALLPRNPGVAGLTTLPLSSIQFPRGRIRMVRGLTDYCGLYDVIPAGCGSSNDADRRGGDDSLPPPRRQLWLEISSLLGRLLGLSARLSCQTLLVLMCEKVHDR